MKKSLRRSLVLPLLVGLSACSHHTRFPSASEMSTTEAVPSSATTQGYQGGSDYNVIPGQHINALRAPADQTYYFDFDSNAVHAADTRAMAIQANYLASHPRARIRLEGNTDNRGSREYNVGLGWRRAQSVQHFLLERGVRPAQIQMMSYGKEHPAVSGNTPTAWRLNRRVNLVYKVK